MEPEGHQLQGVRRTSSECWNSFWSFLGTDLTSRGPGPTVVLALGPDSTAHPGQTQAQEDLKSFKEGTPNCGGSLRSRVGAEALAGQVTFVIP